MCCNIFWLIWSYHIINDDNIVHIHSNISKTKLRICHIFSFLGSLDYYINVRWEKWNWHMKAENLLHTLVYMLIKHLYSILTFVQSTTKTLFIRLGIDLSFNFQSFISNTPDMVNRDFHLIPQLYKADVTCLTKQIKL